MIEGRKMICRRRPYHEGECAWGTLRARKAKRNLEIVARASDLIRPLPEGDYTQQVQRVYINGRNVMIEFNTASISELVARRERGIY